MYMQIEHVPQHNSSLYFDGRRSDIHTPIAERRAYSQLLPAE